jgi:DNA-binding HxlR family transcriptional regulator
MRKPTSTNLENEELINASCGMAYTINLIGGRWKLPILARLVPRTLRYNELKKALPNVSERILILQLRELEKDGLISRLVYAEVPPKVEYQLTDKGTSLRPILRLLSDWGEENRPKEESLINGMADINHI